MDVSLNKEESTEQNCSENNEIPIDKLLSNLERCDTDYISQTTEHSVLLFEDSQRSELSNLIVSQDSIAIENNEITKDLSDENFLSTLDNKEDSLDKNIEEEDKENHPANENENSLANTIINTEQSENDVASEKSTVSFFFYFTIYLHFINKL